MKDGYYLLSYKVNGIKNLDKDVKLEFYKKTIDKDFDPREYNVKAIYGENGTGKSAIMTSVKVLKNLMLNRYYLIDSKNEMFLNNLVNKKLNKASFEIEYAAILNEIVLIYKYYLEIELDKIDSYYKIEKEELSFKKLNSKKNINVYSIKNGKLINSCNIRLFEKINEDNGTESLREQTFLSYFAYKDSKDEIDRKEIENVKDNSSFLGSIATNMFFAKKLYIYLDDEDTPDKHIEEALRSERMLNPDVKNEESYLSRRVYNDSILSYKFYTYKSMIDILNKDIKKVCEFIKIFKPELREIEIDKKEYYEFYICNLIFNYGDYKVDAAYESNGIKKLIKLYRAIRAVDEGSIVFIDEMDSNIHDVYLCRLIEYIKEYAKGQLCFTTQSITVMDVLEDRKKSLDFLSRDHEITSWFKNSHYSASRKYKEGYIEKSPFNIEPFDFLKAFGAAVDEK